MYVRKGLDLSSHRVTRYSLDRCGYKMMRVKTRAELWCCTSTHVLAVGLFDPASDFMQLQASPRAVTPLLSPKQTIKSILQKIPER